MMKVDVETTPEHMLIAVNNGKRVVTARINKDASALEVAKTTLQATEALIRAEQIL